MTDIADIRRENLRRLVERDGLSSIAKRAGKPDRQLNDMIAGRKSFGEKVARAIEAALDPARRAGWLDMPNLSRDESHDHAGNATDVSPSSDAPSSLAQLHSNVTDGPDIRGRVPLISWVQAGVWSEAVDIYEPGYAEDWLPVLRNGSQHSYALRVQGDSMTAAHGKSYPEGTIIIVDPEQRSPTSGQRIIAKLVGTNAVTFKVFVEEDGRRWLKPLNPQHPPINDEFRVLGTVMAKYEPE